jgi:transcriptional regulator with XRE-family HTH domain
MSDRFDEWVAQVEASDVFVEDTAALRAAEEIFLAMERLDISRAELARRLGTSAAYVTKILRGNANFTLASLARLARALEGELKIHIAPSGVRTRWIDAPPEAAEPHVRFTSSARIAAASFTAPPAVQPAAAVEPAATTTTNLLSPAAAADGSPAAAA